MPILLQGPSPEWSQVWKNLHNVQINGAIRSTWYRTIHGLIATQIRPFRTHRQPSSECTHCHTPDTLIHPFTECKETNETALDKGQTGHHPAYRLPLHPCHPTPLLLFPNMSIWPSPKHEAILRVVDHMVYFVINHRTAITYLDYTDFMHQNR
jgi:hypothetical protein